MQLREQILRQLGAGLLAPGDQMPTMRQVAVALKVDLNTVRHAYDELERMGAITLIRGRGSFVAEPPPAMGARAQRSTDRQSGAPDPGRRRRRWGSTPWRSPNASRPSPQKE